MRGLSPRAAGSSQVTAWHGAGDVVIPSRGSAFQATHGTYGDDFNGPSLAAKWTRRTVTSGDETFRDGWLVTALGATASAGYLQTAPPSGDYVVTTRHTVDTAGSHMIGPVIVNSSGNGYGCFPYNDGKAYMGSVSAYSYASNSGSADYPMGAYHVGQPLICQMRKSGTDWGSRVGWATPSPIAAGTFYWSSWTSFADGSFSPDRVGFLRVLGGITMNVALDYFDIT